LALVVNEGVDGQVAAVGVFTPNRFAAAPVQWSRAALRRNAQLGTTARAVVLNSGGANACTGAEGFATTENTAIEVARSLRLPLEQVLVCSTGLFGELLPEPKLLAGVAQAASALDTSGGAGAAEAIMTTDTRSKTVVARSDSGFTIGGMAKGAGMLAPALATMLVVLTTDARLAPDEAQSALERAVARSFNRIDSDGCQSTNDTVLLLSSGESGVSPDPAEFEGQLTSACQDLARQLIADAEGASHDIEIVVRGAVSEESALLAARAVARSNLVKAAIFGNDPNWGRIVSELGTLTEAQVPYRPQDVDVTVNGVAVCRGGGMGDPRELVDLGASREVRIVIDLGAGMAEGSIWTNDLTYDYVRENAEYSS
jgi:glutamate N-acetyltransferase/amino-acid N-acetyltransferase